MTKIVFLTEREASLHRQFKNGCDGKKAYRSRAWAEIAKAATMRKGRARVRAYIAETQPYLCQFCGLWHLGH